MLHFDPTINLGQVITTIVFIGGILKIIASLSEMKMQLSLIWEWYKKEHHMGEND